MEYLVVSTITTQMSEMQEKSLLLATILQTVFDPGEARLDSSIPTDLARLMTVGEPIRELFA